MATMSLATDELSQTVQQLFARRPLHPVITGKVNVTYQNDDVRVEENQIKNVLTGTEATALRIASLGSRCGVTVIPVLDDGTLVLVTRYRYATARSSVELPRGMSQPDDACWKESAHRILRHDTGHSSSQIALLGAESADPEFLSTMTIVVLAEQCALQSKPMAVDSSLFGEPLTLPLDECDELIRLGHVDCAVTLSALSVYRARRMAQTFATCD